MGKFVCKWVMGGACVPDVTLNAQSSFSTEKPESSPPKTTNLSDVNFNTYTCVVCWCSVCDIFDFVYQSFHITPECICREEGLVPFTSSSSHCDAAAENFHRSLLADAEVWGHDALAYDHNDIHTMLTTQITFAWALTKFHARNF